jgi:hypothetical protein
MTGFNGGWRGCRGGDALSACSRVQVSKLAACMAPLFEGMHMRSADWHENSGFIRANVKPVRHMCTLLAA